MEITTKVQAKAIVSALRRELKTFDKAAGAISHNEALTVLAKAMGFTSWNAWESSLADSKQAPVKAEAEELKPWSPAQGLMSDKHYAQSEGVKCPVCGFENGLEGDDFDVDAGYATQEMSCSICNSSWKDQYTLVGFSDVEREDGAYTWNGALAQGLNYALRGWLGDGNGEFDEATQLKMVKLVDEANAKVLASDKGLFRDIDSTDIEEQLTFLRSSHKTTDEFVDFLAEKLGADKAKLIL